MKPNLLIETPKETIVHDEAALFRKRIKVNEQGTDNFIFKIAETKDELESAYRLIHDVYVKNGYMNTSDSGLRLSYFNALPYTQTFIGSSNNQAMITVTLIPDSTLGVPMDNLYKTEVDQLRKKGRYVAEVGGLVSAVSNQNILIHLIKTLYIYADKYLNVDDLVATVHPKHSRFHEFALCFEELGAIKNYSYVNDNPAIALRLDLHKYREMYWNYYPREPEENDLYHFFFEKYSKSILLPEKKRPLQVWNLSMFNYFFKEKTNLYFETDIKIRNYINTYYRMDKNFYNKYAGKIKNITVNNSQLQVFSPSH